MFMLVIAALLALLQGGLSSKQIGVRLRISEGTVNNHIAGLRAKLEINPARPQHIRTVHGVGYKFVHHEIS